MRRIETGAVILSALSIVVITAMICVEVVLRGALGISTLISAEFAGYLLAANVFLGMAWTFRDGGFIRVEILPNMLHGRAAAVLDFVLALIACLIFCVYTWYLIGFVAQSYRAGTMSVFITRTPLWIPQTVMPVGSALMTWGLLATAVRAAVAVFDPTARNGAGYADTSSEAGVL